MRLFRSISALIIITSLAMTATAQTETGSSVATQTNQEALKTLRHDLSTAIRSMRAGMPIYSGTRDRSIDAVRQALVIVEAAITPVTPPPPAKQEVAEKAQKKEAAPKKAETKVEPAVKHAAPAKAEETPEQKIAASQASMRKGYEAVQKALTDLKAATAALEANASKVETLLQTAASEATKGIALHASQG